MVIFFIQILNNFTFSSLKMKKENELDYESDGTYAEYKVVGKK